MLMIIERARGKDGQHRIQSQSGRTKCWLDGWVAVPEELRDAVWNSDGYCDLEFKDGALVGVVPLETPKRELTVREQIAALKEELEASDYKIIKCSEASLAGEGPPYDIAALHAQRQTLRDQINTLEEVMTC